MFFISIHFFLKTISERFSNENISKQYDNVAKEARTLWLDGSD
jgi:hypothetical protein